MNSREKIFGKLRERYQGREPFPDVKPPVAYRSVVPVEDTSPASLYGLFVAEAKKAGCVLHETTTSGEAMAVVLELLGRDEAISCWDPNHIPLPGLSEALDAAGIRRVGPDADVRVGLTGVDAALAATGSVVVMSGNGRPRAASLLPPVHVAVVAGNQILPDLESWWVAQRATGLEQIRRNSNIVIITGPSRTADIGMQLVFGMHGPRELHLVLIQ